MNSRQSNVVVAALIVIAICAVFVAFNTSAIAATAAGQRVEKALAQAEVHEEVVQVLGRMTEVYDGIGAEEGFLVTDGAQLRYVRYQQGSMGSIRGYEPKFLKVLKYGDGRTGIAPVTVELFR